MLSLRHWWNYRNLITWLPSSVYRHRNASRSWILSVYYQEHESTFPWVD